VGTFGERLQREREMRGVTLEEIAEATKIGTRSLRALEQQEFDKLPGGIFNKGFVRAYARFLGLDEDQAVTEYLEAYNEAVAAGNVSRNEPAATPPVETFAVPHERQSSPISFSTVVTLIFVAVLLIAGWRYFAKNGVPKLPNVRAAGQKQRVAEARPVEPTVTTPSIAVSAAPNNATTPVVPQEPAVAAVPQGGFVVRVKAKETSWLSIVADGKQVMSAELPANTEKSFHAERTLELKTGNVGGVEVFHNGAPVHLAGTTGQVKTVEFTPAGVR
jgi:cytoskeleton protein RodZ